MEIPSIFINRLLAETAKRKASSLHLTVGSLPKIRIDNQLVDLEKEDTIISSETIDKFIKTFLEEEEKKMLAANRELVTVKTFAGNFRFRVSIIYQKNLLSLSFYYIPDIISGLRELNLSPVLDKIKNNQSGLCIVAGPHRTGKTTTVAAILEDINKNLAKNIVTLENPIEYLFVNKKSIIEQRQIGQDVRSVVDGLNRCLQEDVDIVYVDIVREDEFKIIAPLILDLASGNALVIWEINADSSVDAVEKVLEAAKQTLSAEAARYSLSDVLLGVFVQKLVPHRGGGLIPVMEIMLNNASVKSLIREGKIYQIASVLQTSLREGMINMEKSFAELVSQGEVKEEDIGMIK